MQISVTKSDSMAIKSCGSDSHGATVCDPSPGHSPMGLGAGVWICAGWKIGLVGRCHRFPCTVNDWEVYCGVSVISNQGD